MLQLMTKIDRNTILDLVSDLYSTCKDLGQVNTLKLPLNSPLQITLIPHLADILIYIGY